MCITIIPHRGLRCQAGYHLFCLNMCNLNEIAAVTVYKMTPSRREIAHANS